MRIQLNVKASFMKGDDIEHVVLRSPILKIDHHKASEIAWQIERSAPWQARHTGGSTLEDGTYLFDVEINEKIWSKRKAHKAAHAANEVLLYFWDAMVSLTEG